MQDFGCFLVCKLATSCSSSRSRVLGTFTNSLANTVVDDTCRESISLSLDLWPASFTTSVPQFQLKPNIPADSYSGIGLVKTMICDTNLYICVASESNCYKPVLWKSWKSLLQCFTTTIMCFDGNIVSLLPKRHTNLTKYHSIIYSTGVCQQFVNIFLCCVSAQFTELQMGALCRTDGWVGGGNNRVCLSWNVYIYTVPKLIWKLYQSEWPDKKIPQREFNYC